MLILSEPQTVNCMTSTILFLESDLRVSHTPLTTLAWQNQSEPGESALAERKQNRRAYAEILLQGLGYHTATGLYVCENQCLVRH